MVQFDQNLSQFFFIVVEIRPLMSDLKWFDKTLNVFQVEMSIDVKIRLTIFDTTLNVFQVKMSLDVKIRLSILDKTLNSTFDVR
jgi:hypothetical protein